MKNTIDILVGTVTIIVIMALGYVTLWDTRYVYEKFYAPTLPAVVEDSKFTVERFTNLNVALITDNATGCEYFMSKEGVTTPRTYPDGTQFCGQSSYTNVEIDYE